MPEINVFAWLSDFTELLRLIAATPLALVAAGCGVAAAACCIFYQLTRGKY